MYPFVLSWDLTLLIEDDVADDVAADIENVGVAVAADGKLWAPVISSYRWDCQWGQQDNGRTVVPRHDHSAAIAVLHLRMVGVVVVAMNSMVVLMVVVMMSFAGAVPSERTLIAAAAVAALPPIDECTRIGVSSNAHLHSDQRYSRTAIPLLHNGWIRHEIYPRNWLPVVHAIYFAVSMCVNGVQLIPKYQPSLISLHFHLHSVFGMERKIQWISSNVPICFRNHFEWSSLISFEYLQLARRQSSTPSIHPNSDWCGHDVYVPTSASSPCDTDMYAKQAHSPALCIRDWVPSLNVLFTCLITLNCKITSSHVHN